MKKSDCYPMFLDRMTYDIISDRFGPSATDNLTAEIVDEIRCSAVRTMYGAIDAENDRPDLFERCVCYQYKRRFVY